MTVKAKSIVIFLVFFALTIANSTIVSMQSFKDIFEYFIYGILVILSWYYFIKSKDEEKFYKIKLFLIVSMLFSIGLILQNMAMFTKIRLIFTMLAMASYILISGEFLNNIRSIRAASVGIFFGIICSTFLAFLGGYNLFQPIYDKSFLMFYNFGFSGGILYKNYFAAMLLTCFIGCNLFYKYEKKNLFDLLVMIISSLFVYLSGSKGGILLFVAFLFCEFFYNTIKNSNKKFGNDLKVLFKILAVILIFFGFKYVFDNYLSSSATYSYRIRGVNNYLDYVKDKPKHILFGYAEMAFSNENSYVLNIRRFLTSQGYRGYDGSYEMGFINAFIKNGLFGLMGYIICYIYILKKAFKVKNKDIKWEIMIVFIILLLSSLVESYICSIRGVFGIYCYFVISGLLTFCKSNAQKAKNARLKN